MGIEASNLTPEDRAGGRVGIAVGGEGGEGVAVGCGVGVGVGVREGGIKVAVGCGVGIRVGVGEGGTKVAVGWGDGIRVRVGGGGGAVCVGRKRLGEQPTTRPIPIVAVSAMRLRHVLSPVQRDCLLLFIMKFTLERGGAVMTENHRKGWIPPSLSRDVEFRVYGQLRSFDFVEPIITPTIRACFLLVLTTARAGMIVWGCSGPVTIKPRRPVRKGAIRR